MRLERLAQHEARLRERAFARVDEQQHAVDHRERALDLAAEVGVAGRVDDVEGHVAVANRRVLGEDRDALLALEVVRVHDPLVDVLVGAERAGLPEQGVDERGLAVVDVGDDRHIAQIRARGHRRPSTGGPPCYRRPPGPVSSSQFARACAANGGGVSPFTAQARSDLSRPVVWMSLVVVGRSWS